MKIFHGDSSRRSLVAVRSLFFRSATRKANPVHPSILGILIQTIRIFSISSLSLGLAVLLLVLADSFVLDSLFSYWNQTSIVTFIRPYLPPPVNPNAVGSYIDLLGVFFFLFPFLFLAAWFPGYTTAMSISVQVRVALIFCFIYHFTFILFHLGGAGEESSLSQFLSRFAISGVWIKGIKRSIILLAFSIVSYISFLSFLPTIDGKRLAKMIFLPVVLLALFLFFLHTTEYHAIANKILTSLVLCYLFSVPFLLSQNSKVKEKNDSFHLCKRWKLTSSFGLIVCFFLCAFLAAQSEVETNTTPLYETPKTFIFIPQPETLEELLKQPDEDIDILHAALLSGKEINPEIDIEKHLAYIDQLAEKLHSQLDRYASPQSNMEKMAISLYESVSDNPKSKFLQNLSDAGLDMFIHEGPCFAGTLLYMGIAERIGLPLRMIFLYSPTHSLVRYKDQHHQFYIETTNKGKILNRFPHDLGEPYSNSVYHCLNQQETVAAILHQVGVIWRDGNETDKALQAFQLAAQIAPEFALVRAQLGSFYLDFLHNKEKGITELKKAIELSPKYDIPHIILGTAYYSRGNLEMAEEEWRAAYECNPQSVKAINNMGIVYEHKHDWIRAMEFYQKALTSDPSNHYALYNLGRLYIQFEVFERALQYFERIHPHQKNPEIFYMMGYAHYKNGNSKLAIQELQTALQRKPDYQDTRNLLRHIYREQDHPWNKEFPIDPVCPLAPYQ